MHPSPLEAKTLLYWTLQMHWNDRQDVLRRMDPFFKPMTVQSAIRDTNVIMSELDPKRPLSQLAFKFQSDIINKPDKPSLPKVKRVDDLIGMKVKVDTKNGQVSNISA